VGAVCAWNAQREVSDSKELGRPAGCLSWHWGSVWQGQVFPVVYTRTSTSPGTHAGTSSMRQKHDSQRATAYAVTNKVPTPGCSATTAAMRFLLHR